MRSTQVHIDLDALEWNFSCVKRRAAGKHVLGLVKANAYGHGMVPIAKALQSLGIDMLGTAIADEAVELRNNGVSTDMIILTPVEAHEVQQVARNGFHAVACAVEQIEALSQAAVSESSTVPVHLYIDTGMLREGFRVHEAVEAAKQLTTMPGIELVGVCTHFATADDPASPFLQNQLEQFKVALDLLDQSGFQFQYVHAANSGALWMDISTHFTMVRTGLSLFGYAVGAETDPALRPVLSVRSAINSIRTAFPGDSVSYGQRFTATEQCTIATVPIGYGDGYLRGLTGIGQCIIGGKRYPIVGSICMDELMVNLGQDPCSIGQEVVLLGSQLGTDGCFDAIDAIELAAMARTIPYEIITAFSARVPRVYHGRLLSVLA